MRRALSDDELRSWRARAQGLAGTARDAGAAVAGAGAIQAQSAWPARLAVRARTAGLVAGDVDRACDTERSVVRTWVMRGTLHMVPARDVRWMVDLFGPVIARAGRLRRERLGLDDDTCERALNAIETVLRDAGPLTRAELVERIAGEGVRIDAATQAPAHLVMYAAARGLICRGPGDATYVPLDAWAGPAERLGRDEALAELARRYLAAYGPATAGDFTAWSGLPAADGRTAFALVEDEAVRLGAGMLALGEPAGPCPSRLLGHFDALLLGYRSRELVLDPAYGKRIQAGGGIIRPAVLVAGRVAGTWSLDRAAKKLVIEPFGALTDEEGLRAEAEDVGRFLGLDLTVGTKT